LFDVPELHGGLFSMQHLRRAASVAAARVRYGVLVTVRHLRFRLLGVFELCWASGNSGLVRTTGLRDVQRQRLGSRAARTVSDAKPGPRNAAADVCPTKRNGRER